MSCKYWLLFGLLTGGAASTTVACSSKFSGCQASRTCEPGGAGGTAGTPEAGSSGDGEEAGTDDSGSAGRGAQAGAGATAGAGAAGSADDAGSSGAAGEANVATELEIEATTLATGKTYVPFTGQISASGAARYSWSIKSGALPAGLSLQGAQSATVTIAGTPTEAGQFPLSISVNDGSITKTVDVTLVITHSALFLSDRNISGVNELFIAELGAATASAPVRVNASIPSGGGITSYAWSPDGSKVMYVATQSAGGAAELWVASLASPGSAQRVSAAGVTVSNITWLLAGNIAAYNTSTGDAYLVDLSGVTAGVSKLVVSGFESPGALSPSPNGVSVGIGSWRYSDVTHFNVPTIDYVTWSGGTPKSSALFQDDPSTDTLQFSESGRFGFSGYYGGTRWWDLSAASPAWAHLSGPESSATTWSPSTQAVLFSQRDSETSFSLYRGVFNGGTLTSLPLVSTVGYPDTCVPSASPWSPDGNQALFQCGNDLRGISNVLTATAGTDFSLLPTDSGSGTLTHVSDIAWSTDSKWVGFRADRDSSGTFDLNLVRWSTPGVAYKPHANGIAPGVTTWAFAQDSQSVALVGTIAPQNNAGLYVSKLPTSGAPSTGTLVSSPASAVVQTDIKWLPGSHVIAYRATVAGAAQLFAVSVAADGSAGSGVAVSGLSGSGVSSYQLEPAR